MRFAIHIKHLEHVANGVHANIRVFFVLYVVLSLCHWLYSCYKKAECTIFWRAHWTELKYVVYWASLSSTLLTAKLRLTTPVVQQFCKQNSWSFGGVHNKIRLFLTLTKLGGSTQFVLTLTKLGGSTQFYPVCPSVCLSVCLILSYLILFILR